MSPGPAHVEPSFRDQPRVRLPMWAVTAWVLGAPVPVLTVAAILALLGPGQASLSSVARVSVALYAGTAAGLLILWSVGARQVFSWGPLVIGAGVIRMAVALAAGAAIYDPQRPDRVFFWGVLLVALLATLAAETAVARAAIARATRKPATGAAASPAIRMETSAA
ncbi:MAG: hypothetical protein WD749_00325 [Phycisphaerales bacterium]